MKLNPLNIRAKELAVLFGFSTRTAHRHMMLMRKMLKKGRHQFITLEDIGIYFNIRLSTLERFIRD